MSQQELHSYRLTSMEEPTDEMLHAVMEPLAEYVAKHEVAWQMCEGLIEFSRDAEYVFAEGEQEEYEGRILSIVNQVA